MTPILSYQRGAPPWITDGTMADVAEVVGEAERLGYGFCTCSEHVALPPADVERRSVAYWDPLASFSYLAATTSTIDLVAWLVVLGYHHPVELAKRYGQLDLMSNGRLVLGVGVGSLEAEFELIGAQFEGRGPRADDAMRALRAIWGRDWAEYHGSHFDFADWWVEPHAPRTDVPLWVGGRTRRSLRRAIMLGDGWMPFALDLGGIAATMDWARAQPEWEARDAVPFELLVQSPKLDPLDDADGAAEQLRVASDVGITQWGVDVEASSKQHYVEQLAALQELAAKELA
jgi:probable F420-dependent oxidoreductase